MHIGIESVQTLIFIGAFEFTGKTKNQLLVAARLILVNFRPEDRNPLLLQEPAKEYKLPELARSRFEDAFDEIELLGFPVSFSPFDLLQTPFRGDIMARQLLGCHKKTVRMLAYLISRKHVPTKKGDMYFGTWIDAEGEFFDTAHFSDSLRQYPFQGAAATCFWAPSRWTTTSLPSRYRKWQRCRSYPTWRYSGTDENGSMRTGT